MTLLLTGPVAKTSITTYIISSSLPTIRVHAGQDVDPGVVDQLDDLLVPGQVRVAQVVGKVQQQLTSKNLFKNNDDNIDK